MTLKNTLRSQAPESRRDFLKSAAATMLGLGLMPVFGSSAAGQSRLLGGGLGAAASPATARNVIYLYMSGGMSHLDTFDLKPGAETQGPTEAIKTRADDVFVSSHFRNLAKVMDRVAVVNSMFSSQGAHLQGRYMMHTGYELRGTIAHPSLGAWLQKLDGRNNPTLPGHVAINPEIHTASHGFLESEFAPLPIGDPEKGLAHAVRPGGVSENAFDRRMKQLQKMNDAFREKHDLGRVRDYDEMYDQAVKLMGARDLEAFDLGLEDEDLRDSYGRNQFGQGCLLARRLVEHDVRFVEVVLGGWDTHNENFDRMEDQCPILDRALAALIGDLEIRGLLDDTLVVVATEFGRSPEIKDGRNGRDHHPKAFSTLLAGGGIRGGVRWGKTCERGIDVVENQVTVQDFNATIARALGLSLEKTIYSPSGRPFTIADKGQPVLGLFA